MAGTAVTGRTEHRTGSEVRQLRLEHNKVVTDLETLRGVLASNVTLVNEIRDDISAGTANQNYADWAAEMATDHAALITWMTEVDGDLDTINDILEYENMDGVIGGDYAIATAAAVTLAGTGRIAWRRNGQYFEAAMPATITLADDGDITQNKYRAWRIEIADTGAVTATAGGDYEATTAEQALLRLGSVAKTASTVTIGYIVFNDETGAFNIGTTNTEDSENEAIYYERLPLNQARGLTAALGSALAIGTTNTNLGYGTVDAKRSGVGLAQIAADADQAWTTNDVITTNGNFGGHLIITDLAGTAVVSLPADGVYEGASTMDYASLAAATTALDNLQDRLPSMFAVVGRCTTEAAKGSFTFNTDDGAGTDGTFTFTSEGVSAFDRTDEAGTGIGPTRPTTPETVTAALLATLTAQVPSDLGTAALSTTAVDAAGDMTAATVNA